MIGGMSFVISGQSNDNPKKEQDSKIPEGEAAFTEEQLKDYYIVYENKAVKYLRTVFNRYLRKPKSADEETILLKGSEIYIKSKFIVLSRDPDVFGNSHITLIFSDKPDKVFIATVYTGGDLRLDRFQQENRFNEEDLRRLRIRYRRFIEDKKHSM